jgi:hypothetical protein
MYIPRPETQKLEAVSFYFKNYQTVGSIFLFQNPSRTLEVVSCFLGEFNLTIGIVANLLLFKILLFIV